ncbi:hypothetical protein ACLB2K_012770 [Fragaria x ananassa]
MYKFYNLVEHENCPHDYMDSRPESNFDGLGGGVDLDHAYTGWLNMIPGKLGRMDFDCANTLMEKLDALRHANVPASAVYAAECTLNKSPAWCDILDLRACFSESQPLECSTVLVSLHVKAVKNKLQGASTRVLTSERGVVALLTPGKLDLATSQSFRRIFIDNQSWGSTTKGIDRS